MSCSNVVFSFKYILSYGDEMKNKQFKQLLINTLIQNEENETKV